MLRAVRAEFPTSFGIFSPTGHVVMAFANDESAEMAREALLAGGFSETDVTHYSKDEVILECERSKESEVSPMQIGQDAAKIDEYIDLAKGGSGFLVIHAPGDDRARQAVAIVRPYGVKFAEKYNRLTLEELV